jgi:hypothetical protein
MDFSPTDQHSMRKGAPASFLPSGGEVSMGVAHKEARPLGVLNDEVSLVTEPNSLSPQTSDNDQHVS